MNDEPVKKSLGKRLRALLLACVAACALSIAIAPAAFADGTISDYDELKAACESGSGTYTLTTDITYPGDPDEYPRVDSNIIIDLADHTINANGASCGFRVWSGSLTIEDSGSEGNGKIIGASDSGVDVTGGSFTLESGTISGDTDGVWANDGVVEIKGGTISGNIDGVNIHSTDASLKLSGAPSIIGYGSYGGIYLSNTNPMTIAGELTYTTPISVLWDPSDDVYTGVFTSGYSTYCGDTDPSKYFTAAKSGYKVVRDGDEAAIVKLPIVTFKNDDEAGGAVLQSGPIDYGETPIYTGETPTKASAQYTYVFSGWTDGTNSYAVGAALPTVTGDVTYTATYTQTTRKYTVAFVDDDGSSLGSDSYDYGTSAADIVKPADPSKQADDQFSYVFAGWTPDIADVTGDVTYAATYTKQGTITFNLGEGTLDGQTGGSIKKVANVGDTIQAPGTPTLDGYTFKYWEGSQLAAGADYKVEGNHTFNAVYEKNASAPAEDSSTPKTGDAAPLAALISIVLIAGGGMLLAVRRRERG